MFWGVTHDLGLQFHSPTVNLWFYPEDFIKLCKHLEYYMQLELEFYKDERYSYPTARLGDIRIFFTHYETETLAREKWEQRKRRIRYDNIFVVMTDSNNCTEQMMQEFSTIPYPKVLFAHKPYSCIKEVFYCKSAKNGIFFSYCIPKIGIRIYSDSFDWVAWFNREEKMKQYL